MIPSTSSGKEEHVQHYHGLILILLTLPTPVAADIPPHPSHDTLSFGNGHCAAVYDVSQAKVTTLTDHLYAHKSATEHTVDLCYDTYFGLRCSGSNTWLKEVPAEVSYVSGTGIVKVTQHHCTLTAEQYFFSPQGLPHPSLVMIAKVTASAATDDSALFTLHNYHLGSGPDNTDNEQIDYLSSNNTFKERSTATGRMMLFKSLTRPDQHGATPLNPYDLVAEGSTLVDVESSEVTNDAVSGFQYNLDLKAGETAWHGVIHIAGKIGKASLLLGELNTFIDGRTVEQILLDEIKTWDDWHKKDIHPPGLSVDEEAVFRQALNVLRMGQCREPDEAGSRPFGQLVASMPPGKWNISWVRDAVYAISALARSGHLTEARDALLFMLEGTAGKYNCCDKDEGDYVGMPYAISVTRYYGNGEEETDFNADGPNIEFDNFGLFLWATEAVVSRMSTTEAHTFLGAWYKTLKGGVADVLLSLIEPDTGILRADSSIWERHWDNGKRRHHTYSNVMAVSGLRAMAQLSSLYGQTADASLYDTAATALSAAVVANLVDPLTNILVSDLESMSSGPGGYMDTAVGEAFIHGVLPLKGPVANSTLRALTKYLSLSTGPGYKRNDDGDSYDEREWVVMDLRISAAHFLRGEQSEGQQILDWITGMARVNYDLIPELLDQRTADYAGEVPMVGFGAGAYILNLFRRAEMPTPIPDGGGAVQDSGPRDRGGFDQHQSPDDAGGGSPDVLVPSSLNTGTGCSCAVWPSSSWGSGLLLGCIFCCIFGVTLVRDRRRKRRSHPR